MRFEKIKEKRCKDCKYYQKLGGLHLCINTELYRKFNLEVYGTIPLVCFRKEKKK